MRSVICAALAFAVSTVTAAEEYLFPSEPLVRTLIVENAGEIGVRPTHVVTVRQLDSDQTLTVDANTPLKISAADTNLVITNDQGVELLRTNGVRFEPSAPDAALLVAGVTFGEGWWWEGKEDRLYEGQTEIRVAKEGKLNAIVILPLDEYLRGVVPSEIGSTSPPEALKVQAIAARGETLVALRTRKYAGDHYDICADVNCQVFSGTRNRSEQADAAIKATRGLALFHEGEPIGAYYASNCGGFSENAHFVWPDRHPDPVPYWMGIVDGDASQSVDLANEDNLRAWINGSPQVFCNPEFSPELPAWTHKNFRWERVLSADEVTTAVAQHKDIGRVLAIEPGERGVSGRLISAKFVGEKGTFEIGPELAIRRLFSPPLRSAAFIVDTEGPAERPDSFLVRGAGYGHGVGMCQTGAIARALAGQGYEEILTHYYQDSKIMQAYPVED